METGPGADTGLALRDAAIVDARMTAERVSADSQPRWRYLSRGPRPRGVERWRLDLAGRDASGEPATDGTTVFVTATAPLANADEPGEVYAVDLRDGSLRWHVPLPGIHGEPVELSAGVVLVDTIPHCVRRAAGGHCEATVPGGVAGLDAGTGRTVFLTPFGSDALRSRWTAAVAAPSAWVHDGPRAVRALALPQGTAGGRWQSDGPVTSASHWDDALLVAVHGRAGVRVERRDPARARAAWSRTLPYPTACSPVRVGPVAVLPAFSGETLAGAPRALSWASGTDVWSSGEPPHRVETCAAAEGTVIYQVVDGAMTAWSVVDGRRRARWTLAAEATSDTLVTLDAVGYVGVQGRLTGVDLIDGHTAVDLHTGASRVTGLVLWGGHGAVATEDPGVIIGFD